MPLTRLGLISRILEIGGRSVGAVFESMARTEEFIAKKILKEVRKFR